MIHRQNYIDINFPLLIRRDTNAPSGSKDAAIVVVVNCYGSNRTREGCTISYCAPTSIAKCKL
jgi:hypothetical protein